MEKRKCGSLSISNWLKKYPISKQLKNYYNNIGVKLAKEIKANNREYK